MQTFFDIAVWIIFIAFIIFFVAGFNKQQVNKHKNKIKKSTKSIKKEQYDDTTTLN